MRVWLLQGRHGEDPSGLGPLLRSWSEAREKASLSLEVLTLTLPPVAPFPSPQADLLVLAAALCPSRTWVEELLNREVALLVATPEPVGETFRGLAETHPVFLMPPQPTPEVLGLALHTAVAGLRRQRYWKSQVEQLQQRLNDRIMIERAKGILVQRLRISEEEAYKRLRVWSRRQRRQIRDIAQSLLDTEALLLPDATGLLEGDPQGSASGINGAPSGVPARSNPEGGEGEKSSVNPTLPTDNA